MRGSNSGTDRGDAVCCGRGTGRSLHRKYTPNHLYACLAAQVEDQAHAEDRATQAEDRATRAEARAAQAEARAARTDAKNVEAEARAAQAEAKTTQAEARATNLVAQVNAADARATQAEARATQAEARAAQRLKAQLEASEKGRRNERDEASAQVPMSCALFSMMHIVD